MGRYDLRVLELIFLSNSRGLTLWDIERNIQFLKGEYFSQISAQEEIVKGMCFLEKPLLEGYPKNAYERVYLDRKCEEKLNTKNREHLVYGRFREWYYKDGLYYPTKKFLNKNHKKQKNIEKIIIESLKELENWVLLGQIEEYCKSKDLTNTEFLRIYAYIKASLRAPH